VHPFGIVPVITIDGGHVTSGSCVSLTVTVNEHVDWLACASVPVHVTVVTPRLNVEPEGGTHTIVGLGQLSVTVAV
jgi:hypothetical protein